MNRSHSTCHDPHSAMQKPSYNAYFWLIQTQYSTTQYTRVRVEIRSTFTWQPQLVLASLAIMLLCIFSLSITVSRCGLKVKVLSILTPKYLTLLDFRLFKWKVAVTDLCRFSLKCHFWKYFCTISKSTLSTLSIFSKMRLD